MKRRTQYYDTVEGVEIEFVFEPIDGSVMSKKVGDKIVVAYLVHDLDGQNPMESEGEGTLYTYNERVITDDKYAPHKLGLEAFASRFSEPDYDLELDCVMYRVGEKIEQKIEASPELKKWYDKIIEDIGYDPLEYIIETKRYGSSDQIQWDDDDEDKLAQLGEFWEMAKEAWLELWDEGLIGDYLAVPVRYDGDCHGPGTTQIYTCDLDSANAVWVPDQYALQNMDFSACTTHADKMAVADKYAEGVLSTYEQWCNGEVYGCVCHVYDEDGKLLDEMTYREEVWGFVGYDDIEKELKEQFFDPMCEFVEKEHREDVRTQCGRQIEMELEAV